MFAAGEEQWRARLGTLRQVVRQELVARQLAAHLPAAARILDVGCGQGTQALRLARAGHRVTGLDSSPTLLRDFKHALAAEPPEVRDRVTLVHGEATEVTGATVATESAVATEAGGVTEAGGATGTAGGADIVLCHGVLMYFADPDPVLRALAHAVVPGGLVSLLVRNGDALALRPGLRGDWTTAAAAFDGTTYDNRIGVPARADRLADLTTRLETVGLTVRTWYGVRVFTDTAPSDAELPPDLDALLDCEERAGATDPYRRVAALTHVLAVKR